MRDSDPTDLDGGNEPDVLDFENMEEIEGGDKKTRKEWMLYSDPFIEFFFIGDMLGIIPTVLKVINKKRTWSIFLSS